eukprot:3469838-Amphidinium_carterae.1
MTIVIMGDATKCQFDIERAAQCAISLEPESSCCSFLQRLVLSWSGIGLSHLVGGLWLSSGQWQDVEHQKGVPPVF